MTMLSEIKPKNKERVCDLLERAGIKVPRNKNRFFLSLPAFNQPKIVVLNFWYGDQIKQQGENIIVQWCLPTTSKEASPRMQRVHDAIKSAIEKNLKIRIIVLYGKPAPKGSKVSKRSLDSAIWQVTAYNQKTGDCTLTRGAEWENAIDDLSAPPEGNRFPDRANVVVQVIKRDNRVRAHAIKRAKGKCEYCNVRGFPTTNGGFYVEAHHIIALCDSGCDTVDNVIALCPQHHRQAHYGRDAESLESEFIKILKKLNGK
jgi:5-methylcytosine-specific restriction protein A